jgi:ATPase family AAA domain-containing protein 1
LGRRENPGEHEAMRKMKNEFMVNWDGLRTKDRERVLVLAATNRPFDLDEAVIRRLPRRYCFLFLRNFAYRISRYMSVCYA